MSNRFIPRYSALLTSALSILLLSGCASLGPTYTPEDFKSASKLCYDQANSDRSEGVPNWFSRYLECAREHIMPIEIYVLRKEDEVREIYDEMAKIAPLVDKRQVSVKYAYARWDQMKSQRLGLDCAIKVTQQDGGDRCVMMQPIKRR